MKRRVKSVTDAAFDRANRLVRARRLAAEERVVWAWGWAAGWNAARRAKKR